MLNLLILRYKEPMRNYINTLFAFNKNLVGGYEIETVAKIDKEIFRLKFTGLFVLHNIAEYGLPTMKRVKKRGQLFMNGTVPMLFFQIVLTLLRYLTNYNAPGYLTHYWTESNHTPRWLIVLGAVQDILTGGQLVSGTLFLGWCTVSHAISLEFWIEEAQ